MISLLLSVVTVVLVELFANTYLSHAAGVSVDYRKKALAHSGGEATDNRPECGSLAGAGVPAL